MKQDWTESVFSVLCSAGRLYFLPQGEQDVLLRHLQERYPEKTQEDWQIAQQTIRECLDAAYVLGEQVWSRKMEDSHALEILAQRFPGFSQSFYSDVLGQGLHNSMK